MKKILRYLLFGLILWMATTITIQRFKNPNLSETQLFLRIPNAFVLDFN